MCEFECEINTASTERRAQIAGFLTDCGQLVWVKCAKRAVFQKFGNSETLPNIVSLSDRITSQSLVLPTNLLFKIFP